MQKRMDAREMMAKIFAITEQLRKGETTAHLAMEIRKPFDEINNKKSKRSEQLKKA